MKRRRRESAKKQIVHRRRPFAHLSNRSSADGERLLLDLGLTLDLGLGLDPGSRLRFRGGPAEPTCRPRSSSAYHAGRACSARSSLHLAARVAVAVHAVPLHLPCVQPLQCTQSLFICRACSRCVRSPSSPCRACSRCSARSPSSACRAACSRCSARSSSSACHAAGLAVHAVLLQLAVQPLQCTQFFFSLPCGQGLQCTQSCFSLPCGQGLQCTQFFFSLPRATVAVRAVVFLP